ncbi:hypothetical protein BKA65DRAFT_77788 [Rhexocercosporidium sp. MPI-PUGE-AT-0058]|nr:hypothetical protein BKA65DRAFT_77788 [Rhexocercosporidium sp. MPI-PUGE-AT-0058]
MQLPKSKYISGAEFLPEVIIVVLFHVFVCEDLDEVGLGVCLATGNLLVCAVYWWNESAALLASEQVCNSGLSFWTLPTDTIFLVVFAGFVASVVVVVARCFPRYGRAVGILFVRYVYPRAARLCCLMGAGRNGCELPLRNRISNTSHDCTLTDLA